MNSPVPKCPKCGSLSITADKNGYGIGKGILGAVTFGPLGLLAGKIGSKKITITCLNCGHQWDPNSFLSKATRAIQQSTPQIAPQNEPQKVIKKSDYERIIAKGIKSFDQFKEEKNYPDLVADFINSQTEYLIKNNIKIIPD